MPEAKEEPARIPPILVEGMEFWRTALILDIFQLCKRGMALEKRIEDIRSGKYVVERRAPKKTVP